MLDDRLLPTKFDRKDIFTGKYNTMVLEVSLDQMMCYHEGELVQEAFPQLSVDEREFLISGVLPEDQDQYWNPTLKTCVGSRKSDIEKRIEKAIAENTDPFTSDADIRYFETLEFNQETS